MIPLQENETMILLIVKNPSKSNLWNSVTCATPRNLSVNAAHFGKLGEIHVVLLRPIFLKMKIMTFFILIDIWL